MKKVNLKTGSLVRILVMTAIGITILTSVFAIYFFLNKT